MQKRAMLWLAAGALCLTGCTARNWYEGFQMQQRRECEKLTQQYEVQRCLERLNGLTYDSKAPVTLAFDRADGVLPA